VRSSAGISCDFNGLPIGDLQQKGAVARPLTNAPDPGSEGSAS
jgi:hypothetical protein